MEQSIKIKIAKEQAGEIAGDKTFDRPNKTIWEKIGRICLYLLVFLTPLFFLPITVAPLEINKQVFAGILILIAFISYLIHSLETQKIVYPKSLTNLAVVILLLVLGVSLLFSQAKSLSLFGNLSQSDSFACFLIYGLAFFLTAVFFREEKERKWLKLGFFLSLFLVTIFGLLSILGKFIFPWSFSQQIGFNTVGSLLSFAIFIAFGLTIILFLLVGLTSPGLVCLGRKRIKLIGLIGLGLVIAFTLILLNYSFVWLALAFTALIFSGYKFITSKINSFLIVLFSIFLFFGIFGYLLSPLVSLPIEVRPNLSSNWTVVKSLPIKNWFFGSGPTTFDQNWALYRPKELNQTNLWPLRFNQGFSFLATLPSTVGILGFLAVIFLIYAFSKEVIRRKELGAIELGIIFLLLNWLLAPNFFIQGLFIFIGLGLLAALSGSIQEISLRNLSRQKIFIYFIVFIILINLSLVSLFVLGKKYLAAIYYEQGLRVYNQRGDLTNALIKVDRARQLDSSDEYLRALSDLLLSRADQLISEGEPGLAPETLRLEVQNIISLAIDTAQRATLINKNNFLNWDNLANVWERIIPVASGADSAAEENYKKAIALDPKNPQEFVNLARSLISAADIYGADNPDLRQDRLNKAKTYLEESLKLKSDYAPAHFLLAAISMREGNTQEAIGRLELTKQMAPFDKGLVFQLGLIYYQNNQLDKAKGEFERAIGIDPNYSNARYFLGLIYDNFGNKEAALEQFEKIAELNPDNQEVKKIIENLRAQKPALEGIVPPAQPPAERLETPVSD